MPRAFRLSAVLAAAAVSLAGPASAQLDGKPPDQFMKAPDSLMDGSAHERRSQISGYGVFLPSYGPGAAVRYALPIFKDGFIPELNESIELELGGDFIFPVFGTGVPLILIAAEPRWTFHFTPQVDGYFKLGVGVLLALGPTTFSPFQVLPGIGVSYRLGGNLWLRLEASYPILSAGVGLDF